MIDFMCRKNFLDIFNKFNYTNIFVLDLFLINYYKTAQQIYKKNYFLTS